MEKKPDTPDRVKCRKYEAAHKEERRRKHKNFNVMLYRNECEIMERFCEDRGMTKADFLRYGFELILREESAKGYDYWNKIT